MSKIKYTAFVFILLFCLFIPNLSKFANANPKATNTLEDSSTEENSSNGDETQTTYTDIHINTYNDPIDRTNTTVTRLASTVKTLDSITINGEEIEGFGKTTYEYRIIFPSDTTSIELDATKTSTYSEIEGTGNFEVSAGNEYQYEVIVTAQDGSTQSYFINVYIDTTPTAFITFNDTTYGFEVYLDGVEVPKNFNEIEITYQEKQIKAWKHKDDDRDLTIVYLSNDDNKGFYIYKDGSIISVFHQFIINDEIYEYYGIPTNVEAEEGFVYNESLVVKDYTLSGWKFSENKYSNYYLLYLTNEVNETDFYVYGTKTDKIMTLSAFKLTQEQENSGLGYVFYIAGGAIILISLGFIVYLIYIHKRRNRKVKKILKNVDKEIFDDLPITYTKKKGK